MKKEMSKVYEPQSVENRIYQWWKENGYFKPEVHPDGKPYTIIMPPPNITGQLHMGHAFDDTLQDVLIRYKRMHGYAALWIPGMDHASIATEVKVVEKIREEEGLTKEELGREAYLERAWDWANKYRSRIREQVQKLGASCDWDRECFTMDEGCSHAVTDTFVRLYEEGLIYKGSRIINWCTQCKTALSEAEVDYSEEEGHLWHIKYPIAGEDGFVVVATTRPETMLGDTGVAVNPDDERYLNLVGKNVILPIQNREIPVVADSYVDIEFGTGVVKMTPAHDPNDYEVGKRHNLEEINVMNEDGTMNHHAGIYENMDRYECRKAILAALEEQGLLLETKTHMHNVGHCYRCHNTVETMTSEQWFVNMEPLAKPAIEVVKNKDTQFIPERFSKTYFNWMENIRDWCISRQLWWGHRIPAYTCDDCGHLMVAKETPLTCTKCGHTHITQDKDVLDTWFSSGLWPFSTLGWPDETTDLKNYYPNSVLVTGYDIIFFWVARMIFMGMYNMEETPFSHVYIHGLIRDSQGRKMSKSLGNGIDPLEVIEDYSADALRFAIITGNSAGNDIRWQSEKIESSRNFLNKIWNAARFVLMNLDEGIENQEAVAQANLENTDKWILNRLNKVIDEVTQNMEKYELGLASQKVYDFAWGEYCDWYIELVKPRLYDKDNQKSRIAAQFTLNQVLQNILKLLHPVIPFITEEIYAYLPGSEEAIIKAAWPKKNKEMDYAVEEKEVTLLMEVVRNIRNIRKEAEVPNAKKADLYVLTQSQENEKIVTEAKPLLEKLASVDKVASIKKDDIDDGYVGAVIGEMEIYLSLDDLVDKEKEIARLTAEKDKAQKEKERLENKLSNPGFVSKAPQMVVDGERKKLAAYQEILEKVEARLEYFN